MERSTEDENGFTTVPAAVREALNLHAGAVLDWHVMPGGAALVRPKTKSIKDFAGLLRGNASNAAFDSDDMNPWRDR
ncbi:AbrB/MazE/SpoVT family DNA-binding domain-containing protein [Paraburkholderia caribensis]|uniref:AbrB/MazE/SpoVT family DNA-binding domain-containing protein n=1 Tax=Paraburkholderia caribensis TaxID=75105 RepID=UPI001CAC831A|nr:AbrB/MazE/SpoVT family DNA-binding domain-containing protein [Paraburkholderia caribensis]CAG9269543.1 Looped-hinge helix DNA binding domain-containing protein, AbrB family [Paraburkholderia caribensis]